MKTLVKNLIKNLRHAELDSASYDEPSSDTSCHLLPKVERIKRKGFTLAEVLITLGIIGIVAALVIPNAVSNYRKHIVETKLKQTYSILANAVSAAETEIGMPFGKWYMTTYYPDLVAPGISKENSNTLYQDFIKPYLNTKNIKENKTLGYIKPNNAVTLFGTHFTLPNGCTVFIYGYQIYVITEPLSFNSKKPIKPKNGKNFFNFGPVVGTCSGHPCVDTIPHTFAPMVDCNLPDYWGESYKCRPKYTNEQIKEKCAQLSNSNEPLYALYCTQLFIENGMKFPKDYPIKF